MKRRINLSRPRRAIYHDDTFYSYGRSGKRTRASAAGNRFGGSRSPSDHCSYEAKI